jgi:ketosteroid isomerase-like protein
MNPTVCTQFIDQLPVAFAQGDPAATSKPTEAKIITALQAFYRALLHSDMVALAACLTEDVSLEFVGPSGAPFAGQYQGRPQVVGTIAANFALLEDQQPELETVIAQGDSVVVVARERGRFRATSQSYLARWVQIITYRGDQICKLQEFFNGEGLEGSGG